MAKNHGPRNLWLLRFINRTHPKKMRENSYSHLVATLTRRGPTPVSTVFNENLWNFHSNNLHFDNNKETLQVKICNMVWTYIYIFFIFIFRALDTVSFIRGEWNWPISCLNDSQTQERGLQGVKFQGNIFRTPLDACTFGARSGNRSVFILDPRLINPLHWT